MKNLGKKILANCLVLSILFTIGVTIPASPANALNDLNRKVFFNRYNLLDNNIVSNVTVGTSVEYFRTGISVLSGTSLTFKSKTGAAILETDLLTTGSQINVVNGVNTTTYTILMLGDVDNDGAITITDLTSIKSHILKISILPSLSIEAKGADISLNSSITISDLLAVKKSILNVSSINQDAVPSIAVAPAIDYTSNEKASFSSYNDLSPATITPIANNAAIETNSNFLFPNATSSLKLTGGTWSDFDFANISGSIDGKAEIVFNVCNPNNKDIQFFIYGMGWAKVGGQDFIANIARKAWTKVKVPVDTIYLATMKVAVVGENVQGLYFDKMYLAFDSSNIPAPQDYTVGEKASFSTYNALSPANVVLGANGASVATSSDSNFLFPNSASSLKLTGGSWSDFDFINTSGAIEGKSSIVFSVCNANYGSVELYIYGKSGGNTWANIGGTPAILLLPKRSWTKVQLPIDGIYTEQIKIAVVGTNTQGLYLDKMYLTADSGYISPATDYSPAEKSDFTVFNDMNTNSVITGNNGTIATNTNSSYLFPNSTTSLKLVGDSWSEYHFTTPINSIFQKNKIIFNVLNTNYSNVDLYCYGAGWTKINGMDLIVTLPMRKWTRVEIPVNDIYAQELFIATVGSNTSGLYVDKMYLSSTNYAIFNNWDNMGYVWNSGWSGNETTAIDTTTVFGSSTKSLKLDGNTWSAFNFGKDSPAVSSDYTQITYMIYNSYDMDVEIYNYGDGFLKPGGIDVIKVAKAGQWTQISIPNDPLIHITQLAIATVKPAGISSGSLYIDKIYYR